MFEMQAVRNSTRSAKTSSLSGASGVGPPEGGSGGGPPEDAAAPYGVVLITVIMRAWGLGRGLCRGQRCCNNVMLGLPR